LHYDNLGSVDTITNQQGAVVERMAYKPFGEQIDLTKVGKSITNRGYTGHEHIKGTDFIHMNARLYDPTIGRFLSADTIIQAPYDSQSYNRYSYVRNNPLKYTDPTGHSWLSKTFKKGRRHWKTVATIAAVVAVGVMTGGAGFTLTPFWQGAAMGFTGGFVGSSINGGSLRDSMRAGVIGGIIGGVTAGIANGIGEFVHTSVDQQVQLQE
jgi:RHS repeat-associated protein